MNLDILILGNYSQFVWPAFIVTFTICIYFYFKTKKALLKQEKLFLREFQQNKIIKAQAINHKKNTTEALSSI
jgi:heme exporter protein D